MNSGDICLISPIEQNKEVVCWDGAKRKRWFEDEAIRMVRSWRKNGGWLKDINIYIFNVNGANIQPQTVQALKELGCSYVDSSVSRYEEIGFMTEPRCGQLAEETVKENISIKIDLDMQLLKPLDEELIQMAYTNVLIEQYADCDLKSQRQSIGEFNPFDTCFIISNKKSGFYGEYCRLCHSPEILNDAEWLKLFNQNGFYYIEEFTIDHMFKNGLGNISPMQNHIFGEGYDPLDSRTDDEVKSIRFVHSHIYKDGTTLEDFSTQYTKRMCNMLLRRNR